MNKTVFDRMRDIELSLQEANYAATPAEKIEQLCHTLTSDGSWPDIDYADRRHSAWAPAKHIANLLTLLAAAGRERIEKDDFLRSKAIAALDFWLKSDPLCPNWWYNQIGVPNPLCIILLFLQDVLNDTQREKCCEILMRGTIVDQSGPGSWTGANLIWAVKTTIKHAIFLRDADRLAYAASRLNLAVTVGENEGMQTDGSFFQHGHQLAMGHYGWSFIEDIIPLCRLLTGTAFQISAQKLRMIEKYILDGMQYMVYRNHWNYFSVGRALFRTNSLWAHKLSDTIELLATVEEVQNKAEFLTLAKRLRGEQSRTVPDKYFPVGEYYCRFGEGYYIGARVTDANVWPGEICNGEGILGYNLASGGVQCILVDGDEYDNLAPVWDYAKIPGVTTLEENDEALYAKQGWDSRPAKNTYCGGMSDGKSGILYMDVLHNSITGVISRFFIEGGMVALGAALQAESGRVISTVNQCRGGSEVTQNGNCLVHDRVTYLNLCDTPWQAETKIQSGSWHRVAAERDSTEIVQKVFTLWYDHGESPKNGQYAYAVFPNRSDLSLTAQTADIEILQNTADIQAIRTGNTVMAVFHTEGSLPLPDGSTLYGKAQTVQTVLIG